MSEYQLAYDQNVHNRTTQQPESASQVRKVWLLTRLVHNASSNSALAQVEWYQSGAGGNSFVDADLMYDAPSTSAGNFGTFEEEEPLLQGMSMTSAALVAKV